MVEGSTFRILTVCTANICRSPLMERLLAASLASHPGPQEFVVESAGVRGWEGAAMDASAAAQLRRLGGDADGFKGRTLQDEYVAGADLVLTATTLHRVAVLREVPQALRRTFTLLEFAHLVEAVPAVRAQWGRPADLVAAASAARGSATLTEYDVEDPYGRDEVVHQRVADVIRHAVDVISHSVRVNSM
ncbi:MAG: hypothetical protein WBV37_00295 [Nocardioidaceae bacterium]